MPFPVKSNVADELIVADILESWSIEEIRQLIKEIEAELHHRRALVPLAERKAKVPAAVPSQARAVDQAI